MFLVICAHTILRFGLQKNEISTTMYIIAQYTLPLDQRLNYLKFTALRDRQECVLAGSVLWYLHFVAHVENILYINFIIKHDYALSVQSRKNSNNLCLRCSFRLFKIFIQLLFHLSHTFLNFHMTRNIETKTGGLILQ